MGMMGMIGPAMSLGSKAMSGGGGKGGGGGGGGISPQQAALAQYNMGQQMLATRSGAANSGLGASTMKTYEIAGNRMGGAMQMAGMADANAQAAQSANSPLQQLAQQQGQQNQSNSDFGQGFGSTGGDFSAAS